MKVKVAVKQTPAEDANIVLDLIVAVDETVANLKDRVAEAELIGFPDQDLTFNGQVLEDDHMLIDCGIQEGSALSMAMRISAAGITEQIQDLVQSRDLTCDEVGLLYCYKHGLSLNQALKAIGFEGNIQEFVREQKGLQLENGRVSRVRKSTGLQPFSVAKELEEILHASDSGSMDIKELCNRFSQKFKVSMASLVGTRPGDFLAKEKDRFIVSGRGLVSLRHPRTQPSAKQLERPPPGLTHPASEPVKQCEAPQGWADSQEYMELHEKISSGPFNDRAAKALTDVVEAVSNSAFINIEHIVKGGSVGKDTAISGATDAEIVCFVSGLPQKGHQQWLSPLLRATAGTLTQSLKGERNVESVQVAEDSVQIQVKGLMRVDLRFSPVFETYGRTIQCLGEQGADVRGLYVPSLARERVRFITRQPSQVRVTIRLMKWWRDQQAWSNAHLRPSDEILELITVYSAVKTKPASQRLAIANVMLLLARFEDLRIVWSNYYRKDDVWAPLLRQRPLLMDPVNPFVNIADPQAFDCRELMEHAQTTHFFW